MPYPVPNLIASSNPDLNRSQLRLQLKEETARRVYLELESTQMRFKLEEETAALASTVAMLQTALKAS